MSLKLRRGLYRRRCSSGAGRTLAGLVLESDGRNEVEQLDELRLDCD